MNSGRTEVFHRMIGERIAMARKDAHLTQQQLSDQMGFKDRQILSNIEAGKRKVSADELMMLIRILRKDLPYFTDPLRLVGEGAFCWRAQAAPLVLDSFEEKAKSLVAMYRTLGKQLGEEAGPLAHHLPITARSSFEEASAAGEHLARMWNLGEIPSQRLVKIAEDKLSILVIYVDPPEDISGAACHLGEFDSILINRNEPDGRRAFDFAHELFHLLTWQAMPPERIDDEHSCQKNAKRREQLANNFASAVLIPRSAIEERWNTINKPDIHKWLNKTAEELDVTARALFWRMRNLGFISSGDALQISDERLIWNGRVPSRRELPKLYSEKYVNRLREGIQRGLISVRRAAEVLDCTIDDLKDLIESYGLTAPFDL